MSRGNSITQDERGVQWTLEAFLAALVLLTSLVVVASVTTPAGQPDAEQVSESQLQQLGADSLTLAQEDSVLKDMLLHYNSSQGRFINTTANITGNMQYTGMSSTTTPLTPVFSDTVEEDPISYNLRASGRTSITSPSGQGQRYLVYQGAPSESSVRVSSLVALSDDDKPQQTPNDCTLEEIDNDVGACIDEEFYIEPGPPDSPEYAVVEVELVLWRS